MKTKTQYTCQSCGYSSAKWLGKCPECGSWNAFVEEKITSSKDSSISAVRENFKISGLSQPSFIRLDDESHSQAGIKHRQSTGSLELDRVLGGGMVRDGFVLIGGDPGIGKSTLLLQVAQGLTQHSHISKVLYVSGEESIEQIQSRAKRLAIKNADKILLAAETQFEKVLGLVKELKPELLIMDSLQTFSTGFEHCHEWEQPYERDILITIVPACVSCLWQ